MAEMESLCIRQNRKDLNTKNYIIGHTLITSGVIKNMDKFPSETSLQKGWIFQADGKDCITRQLEEEGLITRVRENELCFL